MNGKKRERDGQMEKEGEGRTKKGTGKQAETDWKINGEGKG